MTTMPACASPVDPPAQSDAKTQARRDVLLYGLSETLLFNDLITWANSVPIHEFRPDFHRLQVEHWIWSNRSRLRGRMIDVGVQNPRRWIGPNYRTMGLSADHDLAGDLRAIPLDAASLDAMIVTEVLEHCAQPFEAMREMYRVLRPGALLLITSPFIWPWHGNDDYKDFWRFTEEGWKLLLEEFTDVKIWPCQWTTEGRQMYDLLRRFECMGYRSWTTASTGYLCEAIR